MAGEAEAERNYIRDEVRTLVRKNRNIESTKQIAEKILEFETRIETGIHYKIPYPRPINVIPGATGKNPTFITPVYLHSYQGTETSQTPRKSSSIPVYDE